VHYNPVRKIEREFYFWSDISNDALVDDRSIEIPGCE
jgi:hypothetical protein